MAVVESIPLYTYVRDNQTRIPLRRNPEDGVAFLAVPIAWLRDYGIHVHCHDLVPPYHWPLPEATG